MATKKRTRRPDKTTSSLSLPSAPVEPSDDLFDYNLAIFGRKSVGKSTLASQFPDCLTFRFERGRRNIRIRQVPEDGSLLTWESFREYLDLFCESDEYRYASIDSIDKCYLRCFEYICKKRGCKHPNEMNDFGQTWNAISEEFANAFDQIQDAGKNFVVISHEKTRKWENPDGSEIERIDLTTTPSSMDVIKERCEFIFYYGYAGNDRVITIRNDNNKVECAAGMDEFFCSPEGVPLKRFEVPNNPKEVLPTIMKAWNNELHDYDYEPPKTSTSRRKKRRVKK